MPNFIQAASLSLAALVLAVAPPASRAEQTRAETILTDDDISAELADYNEERRR